MNLRLRTTRKIYTEKSTIGELYIDGVFECYTLEDRVRAAGVKIHGRTAIPAGTYKVVLHNSPSFGKLLPHIIDVPGFKYILIHWGNFDKDTEGCLLVGTTKDKDSIGNSRLAFNALYPKIKAVLDAGGTVVYTVEDEVPKGWTI